MKYREIPENRILKFASTAGFKGWKPFFSDESISHPAKMNLKLLEWILSKYTKPSETVLDPMAGTGSTVLLASLMGRDGIAVEYESKFCKMIEDNIARVEKQNTFTHKGKMACFEADARELSKILGESDAIITSPPYSEQNIRDISKEPYGSKRYGGKKRNIRQVTPYSDDPDNIGNLKHGDIDLVLTSPPYGNRLSDVAVHDGDPARMGYRQTVDVVLTSPPYGSDNANLQAREDKSAKSVLGSTGVRGVELDSENLGNLKYGDIDVVITSPPFASTLAETTEQKQIKHGAIGKTYGDKPKRPHGGHLHGSEAQRKREKEADKINIGHINIETRSGVKLDTYLNAMLQVYRESYKVLKTKGIMVLVTKNFIRDKSVVRLDLDTIKLCEKAGFKLMDRWYFKLPQRSFWKILYHRKYPSVPTVDYEDVLVFSK